MICNHCFEDIPDGATTCPKCGAQLTINYSNNRGKKKDSGFFRSLKKKMKQSSGPLFDEEGNLIRYDDSFPEGSNFAESNLRNGEYGSGNHSDGSRDSGRYNGKWKSQLNLQIVIILVVSLIAIIGIIIFTIVFMKHHDKNNTQNETSENTEIAHDTVSEPEYDQTSTTSDSSSTKSEVDTDRDQPEQQAETTEADSRQNTEKSSFDTDTADSYFWPNSDSRLYTFEDLENLSVNQIKLIKAEIYAREGCIFKDQEYNNYFKKKSWYNGTVDEEKFDPGRLLNYYELENVRMIDTFIYNKR